MNEEHKQAVLEIYKEGVAAGLATFNTEIPVWDEWSENHFTHSRFVAIENNAVIGWAAISPTSKRPAYKGVAEASIYISHLHQNKGIGTALLRALIKESEMNGIWTLYAGILSENKASIALFLKNEFRMIGTREKIAQLNGVWKDTVLLERRSKMFKNNL